MGMELINHGWLMITQVYTPQIPFNILGIITIHGPANLF